MCRFSPLGWGAVGGVGPTPRTQGQPTPLPLSARGKVIRLGLSNLFNPHPLGLAAAYSQVFQTL
ncbi:MAG: hypothetical protein AAGG53_04165 [Cyanobacteria bacterium P01_H01_bin.152]